MALNDFDHPNSFQTMVANNRIDGSTQKITFIVKVMNPAGAISELTEDIVLNSVPVDSINS